MGTQNNWDTAQMLTDTVPREGQPDAAMLRAALGTEPWALPLCRLLPLSPLPAKQMVPTFHLPLVFRKAKSSSNFLLSKVSYHFWQNAWGNLGGREVYFYFSLYTTLYFHIFILYDIQFLIKEFIERTTGRIRSQVSREDCWTTKPTSHYFLLLMGCRCWNLWIEMERLPASSSSRLR